MRESGRSEIDQKRAPSVANTRNRETFRGGGTMTPRMERRWVMRGCSAGDDGAALVEFALILPLLVMLLLGLFSGGLAYNQKLDLTHATREGSRYGATIPTTQVWSDGGTWQSNIRQYVVERAPDSITPGQVCVALVQGPTPSVVGGRTTKSDGTPCLSDDPYPSFNATNDTGRRVQVQVQRPGTIELGVLPPVNFTISSRAVTKSETNL